MPELIFCAAKQIRFTAIAVQRGVTYGAQLPNTIYAPPEFTDQNWKSPQRLQYIRALKQYRPRLATVLDLERPDQFDEVMLWAHTAARYVSEAIVIIPKYIGAICRIPHEIDGIPIRLGYSTPTGHGQTLVPKHHFNAWPNGLHILGGNPLEILRLLHPHVADDGHWVRWDVRSVDCNYIMLKANKWCEFLLPHVRHQPHKSHQLSWLDSNVQDTRWRQLQDIGLGHITDAPYRAFELSLINFKQMVKGHTTAAIRFASGADIPAIRRIINQHKRELGYVLYPAIREAIDRHELYVAVNAEDVVIGFVLWYSRKDGWHTIRDIAVHRDYTRHGIGRMLFESVPRPNRLKCPTDLPSNCFYRRMGMTLVDTQTRKRNLNVWELNPCTN